MSIASEIQRLQQAKADIKATLESKGVIVSSSTTIDGYAELINNNLIKDKTMQYLTFKIIVGGDIKWSGSTAANSLSYSKDNGSTWTTVNSGTTISVSVGDKVMWKGTPTPQDNSSGIGRFSGDTNVRYEVEGNTMSLLFGDNFIGQKSLSEKNNAFRNLFRNNANVVSIYNMVLPATTLSYYCYNAMFRNCSSLTCVPYDLLPATTLTSNCYNAMFHSCSGLTTTVYLPSTTLADNCYNSLFAHSGIINAPELRATVLADSCYKYMLDSCTNLRVAPELPAKTLVNGCYAYMLRNSTNVNNITCLATDISATDCTIDWTLNVAASGTFTKASSMSGWTTGDNGIPNGWTVVDAQ